MVIRGILILATFAALVRGSEVEEIEQKKRGASKPSSINAIPTGAQKPEYTYSIYSQNPAQNSPLQQVSSFYPNQPNQYYSSNPQTDAQVYPSQPQLNLLPPTTPSQYVPFNFLQSQYQPKIQLVPSKSPTGNIQFAFIPQASSYPSPVGYPQLFSPQSNHQQHNPIVQIPQGINANYQHLSFGNPYLSHPSMLLLAQPNPSLYNNLLYPNQAQNVYPNNYYPSSPQPKVSYSYSQPTNEYDKVQSNVPQSLPKEDNDISNSEYITPSESSTNYNKNVYSSRSSSYTKLQ